jgi:hypothetical protein
MWTAAITAAGSVIVALLSFFTGRKSNEDPLARVRAATDAAKALDTSDAAIRSDPDNRARS